MPKGSEQKMVGKHIKVMGRGSSDELSKTQSLFAFLEDLSDTLELDKIMAPVVAETDKGAIGYLLLEAGYVHIVTWPYRKKENKMFSLDVYFYPRYDMDIAQIVNFLEDNLGAKKLVVNDISYALEYENSK